MMNRKIVNLLTRPGVLALPLALAACATTGTAVGELSGPGSQAQPVTLVWKSNASSPEQGSISGTLADGAHYSGRYFEVVKTIDEGVYGPAWVGWSPYWSDWGLAASYGYDWPRFAEIYTGRVIANLKSDQGNGRVRCRFTLQRPEEGLSGGGSGECQLSSGQSIQHVVLAAT